MCKDTAGLPLFALPSRRALVRARRFAATLGSFDEVFSLENLVASALVCKGGVSWKRDVQAFHLNLLANCARLRAELLAGTYAITPGKRFVVNERGKPRSIIACAFRDRVVQRTLCDRVLVPAVKRVIIYDNGSSVAKSGVTDPSPLKGGGRTYVLLSGSVRIF